MTKEDEEIAAAFEPLLLNGEQGMIFGENQNTTVYIDPEATFGVDEIGRFVERKKPVDSLLVQTYWAKKKKLVAGVGALCSFTLFSILINETGVLNSVFNAVSGAIGGAFGQLTHLVGL